MLYTIFIILFSLAFSYLSYKKPTWALAAIALLLPTYQLRFKIFFVPMTILETMILILFAVWLIKTIHAKHKIILGNYFWLAVAWNIIGIISIIISPNKIAALGLWKAYFFEATLAYLLFINLVKNKKQFNLVLRGLFVGAFISSIWAIIQRFTGWMVPHQYWFLGEGKRVTGFFDVPNYLGLYLGPIAGILMAKLFFSKRNWDKWKFFWLISLILSVAAIILARSEGALIAIIASLFVVGLINKKTRVLSATIILICIALYFGSPVVNDLILSRLDPAQNWSVLVRTKLWSEGWQMLKHNWFFGAGLAGYQTAIIPYHQAQYIEIFLGPHNIFLNFWSEVGLLGLILFFGIFSKLVYDSFKLIKSKVNKVWSYAIIAALTAIFVHGLVDYPYFKNDLSVMFWLFVGIITYVKFTNKAAFDKIDSEHLTTKHKE